MSTVDKTAGPGLSWNGLNKVVILKNEVDLTASAITENDDYQVLDIPANTLVLSTMLYIETAATGTTLTMDIGYGGNGTGTVDDFDANVDGKATGWTQSTPSDTATAAGGVVFTSADTIDVNMDVATSITAGPKFTLYAVCIDLN